MSKRSSFESKIEEHVNTCLVTDANKMLYDIIRDVARRRGLSLHPPKGIGKKVKDDGSKAHRPTTRGVASSPYNPSVIVE